MERWTEKVAGWHGTGGGRGAERGRDRRPAGRRAVALMAALVVGWLASGAGGCGNASVPAGARCDWDCTCKGGDFCDEPVLDSCEQASSMEQQVAEQAGCGPEFESHVSCVPGAACDLGPVECQDERAAYEACSAVDPELCSPAMDRIAAVTKECGGGWQAVYDIPCTAWTRIQLDCWAPCQEAASCEALNATDDAAGQEYRACVLACLDASAAE